MKPQKIGRVLGTGLRVAGRVAGERLENAANAPAAPAPQQPAAAAQPSVPISRAAGRHSGRFARGIGGFLRPFTRVGGLLMLEVTGVLFLIFALIFGNMAWRTRASFEAGPEHAKFLAAAALTVVFLYLSISSFWRTRGR